MLHVVMLSVFVCYCCYMMMQPAADAEDKSDDGAHAVVLAKRNSVGNAAYEIVSGIMNRAPMRRGYK